MRVAVAAVGAVLLAIILNIVRYSYGRVRLDDNATLAIIGLGAICYGVFGLVVTAIDLNLKRRHAEEDAARVRAAMDLGNNLAEDDAMEKITQKARAFRNTAAPAANNDNP